MISERPLYLLRHVPEDKIVRSFAGCSPHSHRGDVRVWWLYTWALNQGDLGSDV